jgi:hypothetical protein
VEKATSRIKKIIDKHCAAMAIEFTIFFSKADKQDGSEAAVSTVASDFAVLASAVKWRKPP